MKAQFKKMDDKKKQPLRESYELKKYYNSFILQKIKSNKDPNDKPSEIV